MTLDDLTTRDARELARLFGAAPALAPPAPHPFVGRYCLLRCHSAGVHAGVLVALNGDRAILRDSRRLWSWRAAGGIALSGVAQHGVVRDRSRLDAINPEIALTGVIEAIPCADVARESIHGA
jgi:hypothetical protein